MSRIINPNENITEKIIWPTPPEFQTQITQTFEWHDNEKSRGSIVFRQNGMVILNVSLTKLPTESLEGD